VEHTAEQIVEKTGVSLRTIRLWVERGLVPKPLGRGVGTRYSEEHRIVIAAVAAFRRQGNHYLVGIKTALRKMSLDDMRDMIGEERQDAPEAEEELEAAKPPEAALPPPPGARALPDGAGATGDALALPAAASRVAMIPLMPNLVLLVGDAASPLVRRIAAEIVEKYSHE
jgi:DNA-binding transcriptional MerR regulator